MATLSCDGGPSGRLPGGAGGGEGPSNHLPIGMVGGGVIPSLCDRVSGLSFSPQTCILRPQKARIKRLSSTYPNSPIINKLTINRVVAEANGKEGGGGAIAVSDINIRHYKNKTTLNLLDECCQTLLTSGGPQ